MCFGNPESGDVRGGLEDGWRCLELVQVGSSWFELVRVVLSRFESVRVGSSRFDLVRFGSIWFDLVRFGSSRFESTKRKEKSLEIMKVDARTVKRCLMATGELSRRRASSGTPKNFSKPIRSSGTPIDSTSSSVMPSCFRNLPMFSVILFYSRSLSRSCLVTGQAAVEGFKQRSRARLNFAL